VHCVGAGTAESYKKRLDLCRAAWWRFQFRLRTRRIAALIAHARTARAPLFQQPVQPSAFCLRKLSDIILETREHE
jgi:hypothetical protein